MTGLLLLIVAALWLLFVVWLSKRLTRKLSMTAWHIPVVILISAILLPLPLIDEIVGGWQFRQLCSHGGVQLDRNEARGKTVYLADDHVIDVENTWTPVSKQSWRFLDAITNEPILSFQKFTARGGILIRTLKISEGDAPLIFPNYCVAGGRIQYLKIFKELDIKQIERKNLFKEKAK